MMIPYVIEKTSSSERSYDIFSRLLVERIVFINGPIATEMSHVIVAQLLFLEAADPDKDIFMYINSGGGEVTAGMAIYDTINFIKPEVSTIVTGQACSMASLLASSGSPGKRIMLPNSRHMIHQPSGGASGMASDIQIQAREIQKIKEQLTQIYVTHNTADKTYDDFERDMDRDTFMSAQEAVQYGLADKILHKREN